MSCQRPRGILERLAVGEAAAVGQGRRRVRGPGGAVAARVGDQEAQRAGAGGRQIGIEELAEAALLLHGQPRPARRGRRGPDAGLVRRQVGGGGAGSSRGGAGRRRRGRRRGEGERGDHQRGDRAQRGHAGPLPRPTRQEPSGVRTVNRTCVVWAARAQRRSRTQDTSVMAVSLTPYAHAVSYGSTLYFEDLDATAPQPRMRIAEQTLLRVVAGCVGLSVQRHGPPARRGRRGDHRRRRVPHGRERRRPRPHPDGLQAVGGALSAATRSRQPAF